MMSIRILFPLIFALEILLAVGLTAAIGYVSQMREARETAAQFLVLIAGTIEDQIDRHLAIPASLVRNYANEARKRPDLHFAELLQPPTVRKLVDSFQLQIPASRSMNLGFANPAGQNLLLDRRGGSKPVAKLSDARKGGEVAWYPLETFGQAVEPQAVLKEHFDPRQQPYYLAATAERRQIVSSIYYSPLVNGSPVVTVAEPVYDGRGRLQVVVSSDIDLQGIGIYMQGLRLPEDAIAFLFNADGYLIASSRRQPPGPGDGQGGQSAASVLDSREAAIRAAGLQMRQQFGSFHFPQAVPFQFIEDGTRQYANAGPLGEKFGLGWNLAIVVPETSLVDNLIQGIHSLAWVSLGLLAVAIVVGLLTAAWMINPILTMGAAATAVERNELTEPPLPVSRLQSDTRRRNEFGHLALVFLRMIEEIRARQSLMETQLEQLRVDIDHDLTQAQVEQISGSEFFQSLKSKARRLREERGGAALPNLADLDKPDNS